MKQTQIWLFIVVLTLSNIAEVIAQSQKCDSIFWPDSHGNKDNYNTIIVSTFHERYGKDAKIECNDSCWLTKITFAGGHHSEEYMYAANGRISEYIYDSKTQYHHKFYDETGKETKYIHKALDNDPYSPHKGKYFTQVIYYENGTKRMESDFDGDGVFESIEK